MTHSQLDRYRVAGRHVGLAALFVLTFALPVGAQDLDLAPLGVLATVAEGDEVEIRSLQVLRVPFAFTVVDLDESSWGLRLRLPLSVGTTELRGPTETSVDSVSLTPGFELLLPVGEHLMLKPFVELGIAENSATGSETLFNAGIRSLGTWGADDARLQLGLSARYSNPRSQRGRLNDYSAVAAAIDLQRMTGMSIAQHRLRLGGYAIVRSFPGLDLGVAGDLGTHWEVGLSTSTDPIVRIAGLKLAWLGLGYRRGDLLEGWRLHFSFPF